MQHALEVQHPKNGSLFDSHIDLPGIQTSQATKNGQRKMRGYLDDDKFSRHIVAASLSSTCASRHQKNLFPPSKVTLQKCRDLMHMHCKPTCWGNITKNSSLFFRKCTQIISRRCLHEKPEFANKEDGSQKTIVKIIPSAKPLFPPPEVLDSDFRRLVGTVMLPPILKDRMQGILRKEAGKQKLGIAKFIGNHQYEFEKNLRGKRDFPFTRGSSIFGRYNASFLLVVILYVQEQSFQKMQNHMRQSAKP